MGRLDCAAGGWEVVSCTVSHAESKLPSPLGRARRQAHHAHPRAPSPCSDPLRTRLWERVDQCVVGEGSGGVCPVPQSTLIREIKLTLSFFEPCSPTQPSKVPTFTYPSQG